MSDTKADTAADASPPGVFRSAFSGADNKSVDIGRVIWAATHVVGFIYQGASLALTHTAFDMGGFAAAHTGLAVGMAGHLLLKQSTEPKP